MPGVGLLLLRTAVGLISAWQGARLLTSANSTWLENGAGLIALSAAAALIVGLLTPCAAALVTIGAAVSASRVVASVMVAQDGVALAHGLVLIDAASLVLLGPGAFSLDARLFGRREIHIRESYRAPPD